MTNLYEEISTIVSEQAKVLVGQLLKRIEVLEKEHALTPALYKAISREHVYENARAINKLIELKMNIGMVKFVAKCKE